MNPMAHKLVRDHLAQVKHILKQEGLAMDRPLVVTFTDNSTEIHQALPSLLDPVRHAVHRHTHPADARPPVRDTIDAALYAFSDHRPAAEDPANAECSGDAARPVDMTARELYDEICKDLTVLKQFAQRCGATTVPMTVNSVLIHIKNEYGDRV